MAPPLERSRVQTRFRDLVGYVTPHAGVLLLAVLLMLAESAIALANPWIAGRFTAMLLPAPTASLPGLWHFLLIWAGLLAAQSALSFGNRYLLGSTGETILAGLRARLYDHLQSLPLGYFHQRRRGEVLALLGNDAAHLSRFVTGTLVGLLPLLVTFIGAVYMMYRISPSIAGIALVAVPLFFLVTKLIARRIRPLSSEWVRSHAEMFATLEENIGMLPAIKSFTREAHESDRFRRSNTRLLRIAKRQLLLESLLTPSVHLMAGLGLLLLLYLSTLQVQRGALPAADLVSILLYGMLLTRPMSGLAGVYGSVQMARGSAQRLLEAFDVRPEPADAGAPALPPVSGHIHWQDIHFAYPNRAPVFAGLDLEIGAGETVALTGDNGSGKSTLIHLLMRFADPDGGRVLIDGVDVRSVSIASLRRQIGLVAQHVLLVNGSVRENIAYGRPDADQPSIEAAARAAQAHGFIGALPDAYETLIGDQGVRLSGGQRQRIALARALLKDPPILVLDEATSMFDPDGEAAFIEDCRDALTHRTVILITHRPASLALADRVLRLDAGRLVTP
jgi:ATP-binding cassette subfamily B protein